MGTEQLASSPCSVCGDERRSPWRRAYRIFAWASFILLLSLVIWRLTHNALAVGVSHARKTQGEVRSGDQTMPLAFSDEEKDLLLTLAAPIDQRQREQFLVEVAAELEAASAQQVSGPALACCIGSGASFSGNISIRPSCPTRRRASATRGEVQSWNTRARPRFIARRASWLFATSQRGS